MATYKRNGWYWMDQTIDGMRYRVPLETRDKRLVSDLVANKIKEIKDGKLRKVKHTFSEALESYLEFRKLHSAPKTYVTDRERSGTLKAFFGETKLKRITAEVVAEYQTKRAGQGVGGRTINLEVGLLRRIMRREKCWARIVDDVVMLPEQPKEARVLTPEEKETLKQKAQTRPAWMVARCAMIAALNTTMRGCELRGLRWRDVDLDSDAPSLTIRRQSTKTDAGARVIPLNHDAQVAFVELRDRARRIGSDGSEHFVFPACENNKVDPNRPMVSWRTAWRNLVKAAGLLGLRFHDLRHHAVTELAELGLGDETIMSIAGHVNREMLSHYSHIRFQAKRRALDLIATPRPTELIPADGTVPTAAVPQSSQRVN